jgi:hypothetical protein
LPTAEVSTPAFADRFADSIGVNVHLHYAGTLYTDFELVRARFAELGVRHLRDGLYDTGTTWQAYYDRHNALGAMGVKGLFTVAAPSVPEETLRTYPSRLCSSFEAYEAINEYDLSGVAAWPSLLRQSLVQLHSLRKQPSLSKFPLTVRRCRCPPPPSTRSGTSAPTSMWPTCTTTWRPPSRHAGLGRRRLRQHRLEPRVRQALRPGKSIVTTETGYWDDPAVGIRRRRR